MRASRLLLTLAVATLLPACASAQEPGQEPGDGFGQPQNPIEDVAIDMRVAKLKLDKLSTGKPTQETQDEIVRKLDAIIAQLEKECEACKGNRLKNRPQKPANQSGIRKGDGKTGDLTDAKQNGKNWAQLPEKDRDRILQSMTEGFPASYRGVLERYYRRLAEEKTAGDKDPPKPAGNDVKGKPAETPAPTPSTKPAA
jgi:hypothetical protein